jgi:DNA polymerase-1
VTHEVATEVEPGYWTWFVDYKKVCATIKDKLDYLMEHLSADDYILCVSDVTNFRKDLISTYKGKRSNLRRPILLKKVRQDFLDQGGKLIPNLEADDTMGILATSMEDTIIVSIDKDMKTIPGKYFKDTETGVQDISLEEANYNHLYQTLIGDSIDGYTGVPGVGPVAAEKILTESPTWDAVVSAFKKKKLTEEDALLQARLAKILRAEDYDSEKGVPILWTPKDY